MLMLWRRSAQDFYAVSLTAARCGWAWPPPRTPFTGGDPTLVAAIEGEMMQTAPAVDWDDVGGLDREFVEQSICRIDNRLRRDSG